MIRQLTSQIQPAGILQLDAGRQHLVEGNLSVELEILFRRESRPGYLQQLLRALGSIFGAGVCCSAAHDDNEKIKTRPNTADK
jgi:hypothetical protein